MAETWLKCTACKNPIAFGAKHWVCSVSTCNRVKFPLVFCTVSCWDSHVADARHRDAWAVEKFAPTQAQWAADREKDPEPAPKPAPVVAAAPVVRRVVADGGSAPVAVPTVPASTGVNLNDVVDKDILIVVSKMKAYIKARSGMSTAEAVADVLSEHVRAICDESIRAAARNDRKTVLERDVPRPPLKR
ncbi:MAG: hypothetical protein QM831_01050 [Kofleriaceae bacterium]